LDPEPSLGASGLSESARGSGFVWEATSPPSLDDVDTSGSTSCTHTTASFDIIDADSERGAGPGVSGEFGSPPHPLVASRKLHSELFGPQAYSETTSVVADSLPRERVRPAEGTQEFYMSEIVSLKRQQLKQTRQSSVKVGPVSITREDELCVFAVRGFGRFVPELGAGREGVDFGQYLVQMATLKQTELATMGCPCVVDLRIAVALAKFQFGSPDYTAPLDGYAVASEFKSAETEDVIGFQLPSDKTFEPRGRYATTIPVWKEEAENMTDMLCFGYSNHWKAERMYCIEWFIYHNKIQKNCWRKTTIFKTWEELNYRWCIAVRENLSELIRRSGKESPSKDDLKHIAFAKGPGFPRLLLRHGPPPQNGLCTRSVQLDSYK
jgi:hypothetical protein